MRSNLTHINVVNATLGKKKNHNPILGARGPENSTHFANPFANNRIKTRFGTILPIWAKNSHS